MTIETRTAPPDWGRSYPSGGEQIGPAWAAAWFLLEDFTTHYTEDLVDAMCEAGPVARSTALDLLRQARLAGIIVPGPLKRRNLWLTHRVVPKWAV